MIEKCTAFCIVFLTLFAIASAASQSMSCVYINNKRQCTFKNDPNGNMGAAAAGISSDGRGAMGAGAGTQDNFNTDIKQIGYDQTYGNGAGNADYQPGQGNYDNGETAVGTGAGFSFNPNFPQFNQGNNGNGEAAVGIGAGFPFNPNFPQFGQENYDNGETAVGAGAGYPFNPNIPHFSDPFQFVQDFFRRRQ